MNCGATSKRQERRDRWSEAAKCSSAVMSTCYMRCQTAILHAHTNCTTTATTASYPQSTYCTPVDVAVLCAAAAFHSIAAPHSACHCRSKRPSAVHSLRSSRVPLLAPNQSINRTWSVDRSHSDCPHAQSVSSRSLLTDRRCCPIQCRCCAVSGVCRCSLQRGRAEHSHSTSAHHIHQPTVHVRRTADT